MNSNSNPNPLTVGERVNALFSDNRERNGKIVAVADHLVTVRCDTGETLATAAAMVRAIPSYRELQCTRETARDSIAECTANPDHAMAYFLPGCRETFAESDRALRAFIRTQRAAGKVLCPITLEWCDPGCTQEDNGNECEALDNAERESAAAMERAASRANERGSAEA